LIPRRRIYSRVLFMNREYGGLSQLDDERLSPVESQEESKQSEYEDRDRLLLLRALVDYAARRAWKWLYLSLLTIVLFWLATHIWSNR
jgi:hypothetical protein